MSTSVVNQSELGQIAPPPDAIQWTGDRAVSTSNAAAFESILAHDLDRLYRVAFRLLRNHEDAEDALQEGLWKAFRRLPSFQGRSALSTWVTRIVINSALMTLRRRKSHLEYSLDAMMENPPEILALRAADQRPDPEQMCAASQFIEATKNQMLQLSDWERAAFHHFVIKGHSARDSASAFGIPVATFKSKISRTRAKLARGMHRSRIKACSKQPFGDFIHDARLQ